jgi:hypothetical protein
MDGWGPASGAIMAAMEELKINAYTLAFFGLCYTWLIWMVWHVLRPVFRRGESCEGTVVGSDPSTDDPIIEFVASSGQTVRFSRGPARQPGEAVPVTYCAADPEDAGINEFLGPWRIAAFLILTLIMSASGLLWAAGIWDAAGLVSGLCIALAGVVACVSLFLDD